MSLTSGSKKNRVRNAVSIFVQFCLALIYVVLHELLLFVKVITLNVAVNSFDNSVYDPYQMGNEMSDRR